MKKVIETYEEFLYDAGLSTSEDGYVSKPVRNKKTGEFENHPVTVKGQRLVLPTEDHLANPDWTERVVFHPLAETVGRKESPVHEAYRTTLNLQLNSVFGQIAAQMLDIAASTEGQARLTPDQQEYLSLMKNADDTAVSNFAKLLDAFPGDRALVNIYIKPSALINEEKYTRGAIVSFPMYEALDKAKAGKVETPEKTVSVRPKDVEMYKKLMEYIIPNIKKKHHYDVGSLSTLAPTMESLMKSAGMLMDALNVQTKLFASAIEPHNRPQFERMIFRLNWMPVIGDLSIIAPEVRLMGVFKGGQGEPLNAPPAPAQPGTAAAAPAAAAPAVTPVKKLISPFAGVDDIPVVPAKPPAPPPTPYRPPAPPAYAPPPPPPPVGYYPPPQPAPAPAPAASANGKVDFMSLVAANPQLAAASGVMAQQNQYYNPAAAYPQERRPGWASGGHPQPYQPQGQYYTPPPAPAVGRRSF